MIKDSVTSIGAYALLWSGLPTIYCELAEQPSNWESSWNLSSTWTDADCPVYWYSEEEPTTDGNYWHYVDGEIVVWE